MWLIGFHLIQQRIQVYRTVTERQAFLILAFLIGHLTFPPAASKSARLNIGITTVYTVILDFYEAGGYLHINSGLDLTRLAGRIGLQLARWAQNVKVK